MLLSKITSTNAQLCRSNQRPSASGTAEEGPRATGAWCVVRAVVPAFAADDYTLRYPNTYERALLAVSLPQLLILAVRLIADCIYFFVARRSWAAVSKSRSLTSPTACVKAFAHRA
jgi:hypothetical protein